MIAARGVLHLAALILPVLPVGLWLVYLGKSLDEGGVLAMLMFLVPAALAAQVAAWLRWSALGRRAQSRRSAWLTGFGMAAITHALFGMLLALGFGLALGPSKWLAEGGLGQWPGQAFFFGFASLMIAGWITLPLTAGIAHGVGRLREREIASDSR